MSITVMQQALEALQRSRVFVTTQEKIKHPEGTDWYDESIANLRAAIAKAEKQASPPYYHPCTEVLIQALLSLKGGGEVLGKWDSARATVDSMIDTTAQRKLLTQAQIESGRRASWGFNSDYFTAGVRFAEAAHGIKEKNT
jgi:hypothetical protein